jgi:hypothetical protein
MYVRINLLKRQRDATCESQGSNPRIAGKRLLVYRVERTSTDGDGTKYTEPRHHLNFLGIKSFQFDFTVISVLLLKCWKAKKSHLFYSGSEPEFGRTFGLV